jgi:hypothetical protein
MKRPAREFGRIIALPRVLLEKNPIQYKSGRRRRNLASALVWRFITTVQRLWAFVGGRRAPKNMARLKLRMTQRSTVGHSRASFLGLTEKSRRSYILPNSTVQSCFRGRTLT